MTWCLGFGLFQFSVLMGDIRTSNKDAVTGEYRPLDDVGISKITLLGPNLAVAFSGSVRIGRHVLELMERKAATYEGDLWHPDKVISWMRAYLAEHYESDYLSRRAKGRTVPSFRRAGTLPAIASTRLWHCREDLLSGADGSQQSSC